MSILDRIIELAADEPDEGSSDLNCVIAGLDAVIDEACRLAHKVDQQGLDPKVQQALNLMDAASSIVDNLMDSWGIHDPDHPAYNVSMTSSPNVEYLVALANSKKKGGKTPKAPYGDVRYADPGYRNGKKRYPLDTEKHVRAALSYFAKPKNKSFYSAEQISHIQGAINAAARRLGIELASNKS